MYHNGKIITISSVKGGVGKTTLTINLAGLYFLMKKKVLIIDLDLYLYFFVFFMCVFYLNYLLFFNKFAVSFLAFHTDRYINNSNSNVIINAPIMTRLFFITL